MTYNATEFANLFTKGAEQIVDIQKKALDSAAQYNAEIVGTCKKAFPVTPAAFGMFDLAAHAVEKSVGMQKTILNHILDQGTAIVESARVNGESISKAATSIANTLRQSADQGIAAQRSGLQIAKQQSQAVTESLTRQFARTPAAVAVESIQRGADVLTEKQLELLDLASKGLKSAAFQA